MCHDRVASVFEAGDIVVQGLTKKSSKALSMPSEDIDINKPFARVRRRLAAGGSSYATGFAKEINADVAVFNIME